MEGNAVECIDRRITEEVLRHVRGRVGSLEEAEGTLSRRTTTTSAANLSVRLKALERINLHVEGAKRIPTSNLTRNEEVVLAQISGTSTST